MKLGEKMHAIFNHPYFAAAVCLAIVAAFIAYAWIASAGINDCDRARDI